MWYASVFLETDSVLSNQQQKINYLAFSSPKTVQVRKCYPKLNDCHNELLMGSMRESHTQTNGLWLFQSIPSIGKYDEFKTFSCHYASFASNSYSPSLLDFDFHPHIHSFSAQRWCLWAPWWFLFIPWIILQCKRIFREAFFLASLLFEAFWLRPIDMNGRGSNPSAAVVGLPPDLAPISGPDVTPSKTTPGMYIVV